MLHGRSTTVNQTSAHIIVKNAATHEGKDTHIFEGEMLQPYDTDRRKK
jgi:hypothetical protein